MIVIPNQEKIAKTMAQNIFSGKVKSLLTMKLHPWIVDSDM